MSNETTTSEVKAVLSMQWITAFAASIEQTYNRLMIAADMWATCGEYTYDNAEMYKTKWREFPDFWLHWSIVTGRPVPDEPESFFTCSC